MLRVKTRGWGTLKAAQLRAEQVGACFYLLDWGLRPVMSVTAQHTCGAPES